MVIIYYFFRKKYTNQTVSSTLFWREMMQETRVSPYLKHLQRNLLFYLQMLALLLLMLALLQPYVTNKVMTGSQVILVVDTSATLLAGKEGENTFEQHRKEMQQLVKKIGGTPLTMITTGESPQVLLRRETNKEHIQKVIDELQVTYEAEQLPKALDVAQAFVGAEDSSIYVFTDAVERAVLPIENDTVKWIVRGGPKQLENVAMTKFAATSDGKGLMALVQLINESDQEKSMTLSLQSQNGDELVKETFKLQPLEKINKVYKELPSSTVLHAMIQVKDDYAADNEWSTIIQQGVSDIIVDQSMHTLVQKGLKAISSNVKTAQSDDLLNAPRSNAFIVSNQVELLQQSKQPVLLIGRNDVKAIEVNKIAETAKDVLFSFNSLENVYVRSLYPAFEDYKTIAVVDDKPFIQRSPKGDIIVLADIQATDWPLHPSFPLFLWNVQNEFTNTSHSLGVFTPNEQRSISIVADEWSIYNEADEYEGSLPNGKQFIAPTKPGIYTLQSNVEQKQFVVQLANQERHIAEGTSFELGKLSQKQREQREEQSFTIWIALLIFLLLLVEWEVQRRRGFTS